MLNLVSSRLSLLVTVLSLCSCGFAPLYSDETYDQLSRVEVVEISSSDSLISEARAMREELERILNPFKLQNLPTHSLSVELSDKISSSFIQQNNMQTRMKVTIIAEYTLKDKLTEEVVKQGKVTSTDAFDIAISPYSTFVAEEETKKQLVNSIAHEIKILLLT